MKLIVNSIPHSSQKYPTIGNYFDENGIEYIEVSEMDQRSTRLVVIHELIEKWLTENDGITEKEITDFDLMFEDERENGKHGEYDEPGDDIRAPYRKQHRIATLIEKSICLEFNMTWEQHENNCNKLFTPKSIDPEIGK